MEDSGSLHRSRRSRRVRRGQLSDSGASSSADGHRQRGVQDPGAAASSFGVQPFGRTGIYLTLQSCLVPGGIARG